MTDRKLIKWLWAVIIVLLVGLGTVTVIALNRADAIDKARTGHKGDIESLKEQLRQAKSPRPSTSPLTESSTNQASPTPTPKATVTPKNR